MFLSELCDVLEVPRPQPASAISETNDYVFERVVREAGRDGAASNKRIDLYKRDCFILEAKQSRYSGTRSSRMNRKRQNFPDLKRLQLDEEARTGLGMC